VAGAHVTVEGTERSAVTDAEGRFTLGGVAPGTTLIIDGKGHETALVIVEGADAGDLPLLPEGTSGEVIEVSSEAPPTTAGSTKLERDEVSTLPGTGNDLVASLKVLPGVGATPFPVGYTGVVIRGSSPQDSKVLVDGFEVPAIYHDIAFRSVLPTDAIETLEYLPGGFDVAYGRASSGLINVTTRRGDRKGGGQAEVSVIDGGVLGHGPAGKDGSFFLAVRRSTIDFVLPAVIPDDVDRGFTTVPRYYDAQARLDEDLGAWQVMVSAFGSDDALAGFADDDEDPDQRFYTRTRFARLIGDARWHKGPWAVDVAASPMINGFQFDFGRNIGIEVNQLVGTARGEVTHTAALVDGLHDVVARAGGEVQISRNDIELATPVSPDEGQPPTMPDLDGDPPNVFNGVFYVPDVATWGSLSAGFGPKTRVSAGVRVDGFLRSGDVSVQPRGEISTKVRPSTTLRLAAGAYRRPAEFQDELQDPDLHPERSTQAVLGLEQTTKIGVNLQASAYYTDRSKLLTRGMDGKYVNQGRGTTVGGELLVTARRGPWFGWLSYSISHSTRRDNPSAKDRLFDYDQPHVLNVLGSYKVGSWQFGLRWSYASGTPYTPVMGAVYNSDADYYLPLYGDVNSERVVAHHQLDARIDKTWQVGAMSLTAFLDVQNAYLNQSVVGYGYNFDYSERFAFTAIPIIPSIGLRGVL
jgi:hypothetical protein